MMIIIIIIIIIIIAIRLPASVSEIASQSPAKPLKGVAVRA